MRDKPSKGQTLYCLNINNAARYREQKLRPVIVMSVGSKYITVKFVEDVDKEWVKGVKFSLKTWREHSNYTASYVLYSSEQEWLDEKEASTICQFLCTSFEYGQNRHEVSLVKLRTIKSLIEGN